MRLGRIAAGLCGWLVAERRHAMALEPLVCRCWQACLPAGMRVRWASIFSEARPSGDRRHVAQVAHFAVLRAGGGGLFHVARGLQPFVEGNRAGPNWHVYPKGARRASRWIFIGCGAAGRGILKGRREAGEKREVPRLRS
jgi:hypothetical protein